MGRFGSNFNNEKWLANKKSKDRPVASMKAPIGGEAANPKGETALQRVWLDGT